MKNFSKYLLLVLLTPLMLVIAVTRFIIGAIFIPLKLALNKDFANKMQAIAGHEVNRLTLCFILVLDWTVCGESFLLNQDHTGNFRRGIPRPNRDDLQDKLDSEGTMSCFSEDKIYGELGQDSYDDDLFDQDEKASYVKLIESNSIKSVIKL